MDDLNNIFELLVLLLRKVCTTSGESRIDCSTVGLVGKMGRGGGQILQFLPNVLKKSLELKQIWPRLEEITLVHGTIWTIDTEIETSE